MNPTERELEELRQLSAQNRRINHPEARQLLAKARELMAKAQEWRHKDWAKLSGYVHASISMEVAAERMQEAFDSIPA